MMLLNLKKKRGAKARGVLHEPWCEKLHNNRVFKYRAIWDSIHESLHILHHHTTAVISTSYFDLDSNESY